MTQRKLVINLPEQFQQLSATVTIEIESNLHTAQLSYQLSLVLIALRLQTGKAFQTTLGISFIGVNKLKILLTTQGR